MMIILIECSEQSRVIKLENLPHFCPWEAALWSKYANRCRSFESHNMIIVIRIIRPYVGFIVDRLHWYRCTRLGTNWPRIDIFEFEWPTSQWSQILRKICRGQLSQIFSFFHCRYVEVVAGVDWQKYYQTLAALSRCDFTDIWLSGVRLMDSYSNVGICFSNKWQRCEK